MTEAERLDIQRLRGLAERHRKKAEIHDTFGELEKAATCRAMAAHQEERALRLERRATAA